MNEAQVRPWCRWRLLCPTRPATDRRQLRRRLQVTHPVLQARVLVVYEYMIDMISCPTVAAESQVVFAVDSFCSMVHGPHDLAMLRGKVQHTAAA